jgi:hypothetical protein
MARSGYILAGFETLATIVDNFFKGKRGRWNENFTREQVSNFLSDTCAGFLHSYGQDFGGKKKFHKYSQKEADLYTKCRDMGIFDGCNLVADSGGFQISIGDLTRVESELLFDMYYNWLRDYPEVYDRAFILDVPPGPGCEIFHNFEDVYELNLKSYLIARDLPDEVRKKIVYIHHFRTPKLWEIYTKIMREKDLFKYFDWHGTGVIVANMSGDMAIPCIIYILPMIPLINEAMKHGRNYLNFHILGGGSFRDVFFYELFMNIVKSKHNFDLNITYDSSMSWKQVMRARFIHAKDGEGYTRKMSIKTNNLNMRFYDDSTKQNDKFYHGLRVEEMYERVLNNVAREFNFKPISTDGVYSEETGTFHEDVKVYSIFYTLNLFPTLQAEMKKVCERIVPIYEAGESGQFYLECLDVTRHINQGKLTKKQKIKTNSIAKSLDMLCDLDEDYCEYLVNNYLAKDEFTDLEESTRILKL